LLNALSACRLALRTEDFPFGEFTRV
jgi:hypothetical protein